MLEATYQSVEDLPIDSDENKANMGKKDDYVKYKKIIREKLKVTSVPNIRLIKSETSEVFLFQDFFDFKGYLGAGSFGFVVQAEDKTTNEMLAIKVSI